MELPFNEWVVFGAVLLFILYKLGTWNHNYFISKGIKSVKAVPFFGSMTSITIRTEAIPTFIEKICKEFQDESFFGMIQYLTPVLVVKDSELIKRITVKDFDSFTDHMPAITEEADPIFGKNLFSLQGERWRAMRATLSPAFTSSKMKNMFHFMNQCGQQLVYYIQSGVNKQQSGEPFCMEMKDLFTRFANDIIATSAFGIHVDSLKERDNEFYLMGKSVTNMSGIKSFVLLGYMLSPKLMEMFGIKFFTKKETKFFFDMVSDTVSTRDREGIVRPDMIHLLMQARKGELQAEKGEEEDVPNGGVKIKKINLGVDDIAGQGMIFFMAGFDTVSSLLSWTILMLAIHQDAQERLQQEMDEIIGHDMELTYEKLQKMKYLDMVLSETLRLYPPAILIHRTCTKNFTIPASEKNPEYIMKKGDVLFIPAYGIHRDPMYYADPDKFDPERFSDENKHNINPWTYLPFGAGPRLCIGQRFALMEAKIAIIHTVSRFNITVVEKTPLPIKLDRRGFVLTVEGGFWVGATPRKL